MTTPTDLVNGPGELSATQDVIELSEKTGARNRTWLGTLWDTADLPSNERRLLFKVDAVLLIFASVSRCFRLYPSDYDI